MFSMKIVDSDAFMDMSQTAQLLYFHLSMRADDDGFIGNPKKIMRMIGVNDDDMRVLLGKRFLLTFDSGIIVIKHWRIHNLIRGDRYTETTYKDEKKSLGLNDNGAYTEVNKAVKEIEEVEKPKWLSDRQAAKAVSDLPHSFDYKIRQAFIGKPCPICNVAMQEISVDQMEYGSQSNPRPSIQHNIPISKGGKHELGNISVVCHSCNVSIQDKETGPLNALEVAEVWHAVGTQSAPQVRLGKVRIGKVSTAEASADDPEDSDQKKAKYGEEDMKMVDLLASLIVKNTPEWVLKGNKETWAEHIEKLHRIDGRTYEQIEYMIRWTQADAFWQQNILSTAKLREKFNDLIPKLKASVTKEIHKSQIASKPKMI